MFNVVLLYLKFLEIYNSSSNSHGTEFNNFISSIDSFANNNIDKGLI